MKIQSSLDILNKQFYIRVLDRKGSDSEEFKRETMQNPKSLRLHETSQTVSRTRRAAKTSRVDSTNQQGGGNYSKSTCANISLNIY